MEQMTQGGIEADSLYRFFRAGEEEVLALKGVSLTVAPGEFVAVAGPSGSGKSTLLACLSGSDEPSGGQVRIAGERISHRSESERSRIRRQRVGLLYQQGNLFPHLTIERNITVAQRLSGRGPYLDPSELLSIVGLRDHAKAYPGALSGGELARAVLLADEPTGELDTLTEVLVLELMVAAAARGAAVVVASHSPEVASAADRIVRLSDGVVVS
jgi:putative ABC transport system ATP-binding protein